MSAPVAPSGRQLALAQRFSVTITFASGSIATIVDGSESASGVEDQLVEAHAGGNSAVLHDFQRRLDGRLAEPPDPLDKMVVTPGVLTVDGGGQ